MNLSHEEFAQKKASVIEKHVRIAKMLMKYNVSCSVQAKDGKTPLGIALQMRKFEFVKLFIKTDSFKIEPKLMFEFCSDIYAPKIKDFFKEILE